MKVSAARARFFTRLLGPQVLVLSVGAFLACGPKEPPKQASTPDTIDPMTDPSSSDPGSSGGGKSGKGTGGGNDVLGSPPAGKTAKGKGGEPPQVASLAPFTEGIRWGISHAELQKQFTGTQGIIAKDYDEKLAKARVGPEMTALEAEREQTKAAFGRSYIEFGNTPTGYDTTGIRNEYTYKNKESLMWIQRQGKKRYFFFINDRLWKMYDEVPLAEGGPMGAQYLDAVNKLNAQLNAQGRVQGPDPAKNIIATTVDWKDGIQHLRAVDRSNDHVVGIVIEENATLSNLAALRPNKMADPMEIDPSVVAVTKGTNRSDPNAAASASASGAASGAGGKKPPKKN